MKKLLINFGLISMIGIISCSKKEFETSKTGLKYKLFNDVKGPNLIVGDIVTLDMIIKNDSGIVLKESKKEGRPEEFPIFASKFKGSFEEGLLMLSVGDSASFWISTDSLFNPKDGFQQMPPNIKPKSFLEFNVKIIKSSSSEAYKAEQLKKAEEIKKSNEESIKSYAKANNWDLKFTNSGLGYVILKEGKGECPKKGENVSVHYTGKFIDGKVFDSSIPRKSPFEFRVVENTVIQGWLEGIQLLKKGSKAIFLVPSHLGYGSRDNGPIPANSVLVFEIELLDINK